MGKLLIRVGLPLVVVAGLLAAAAPTAAKYWRDRMRPKYRVAKVEEGRIVEVVTATGTVKPVLQVSIGSFVSGPIQDLLVDYNDEVKKGEVLARIDPRIYEAGVARDEASLAVAQAEVARVKALLQQAINDEKRALRLQQENKNYISGTEMDKFRFNRQSLDAQLLVAEANIKQAEANLQNSRANLGYTEITSPVDGMVINKKIEHGQTLAAQFQTPELFIVAPDMRTKMYVDASVDEADIGLIMQAKERNQPVEFTVDAWPEVLFRGTIHQVRVSSATTQNVVTYPVIVEAPNADLKLLPGMTASLSFHIDKRENVLKIPNAALRYYPRREQVRPEDRSLLDGVEQRAEEEEEGIGENEPSAEEKTLAAKKRRKRHVWVAEDHWLRAVAVETGLADNQFTELVAGDLKVGQELVTGVQTRQPGM